MASSLEFVESLPGYEDASFGEAYRVGSVVGMDELIAPAIDLDRMSVRVRISTDVVDRTRQVVRQEGISTTLYRQNPVVLFGHGEEGIVLPVAVSEDESGNCTVRQEEDGTYATAFHKASDKTSAQLFDAIASGLLRACSVGITPTEVSVAYDREKQKVAVIDACDLNEWSYCSVGVNPEAIVKSSRSSRHRGLAEAYALQCDAANRILSKGRLDGSEILPQIKKAISALVPKSSAYTVGFDFRGRTMKKLTRDEVKKLSDLQLAKSMASADFDDETKQFFNDEIDERNEEVAAVEDGGEGDVPASDPPEIEKELGDTTDDFADEVDVSGQKPGSVAITKIHTDLGTLVAMADAAVAPIENPEVVKQMTKEIQALRDCLLRIEGIHGKIYPDQPSLSGGDEPDVDDELLKSWLATDTRRQVQLAAIAGRVAGWARRLQAGDIEGKQLAKSLARSSDDILRISESAKGHKSSEDQVAERLEILEQGVKKILEQLAEQPA